MSEKKKFFNSENTSDKQRERRDNFSTPFSKDKRVRSTEKPAYKPAREGYDSAKKSSYNPNFTKDNKLRKPYEGEKSSYGAKPYGNKSEGSDRPRSYGDKPYGAKPYGNKSEGSDRPRSYGDKPYGSKPSYGDKPYGAKPYGNKPEGSDRPRSYGDKPYGAKPYGNKSEGSDRPRSYGDKPYGAKPYGNKSYGNKPGGDRKSFGKPGGKNAPEAYGQGDAPQGDYPKFPAPKFDDAIRLNRYIATSGICSRREADEYIKTGLVTVNGNIITELGTKVQPDDVIKFNDSIVSSEKKVYILMNKPKGFITTLEDDHADKTVMDIVRNACTERVYPVGRLDKNSVGVLLLTNDGDLTKQLTHPSFEKKKIYQVSLDKPLSKADMEQIVTGIVLEDGEVHANEVAYVNESKKEVGIEIHSGRNRIVRRIFEHLGYKVQKLDRVYFAGLTKKNLKRGEWRFLAPIEVSMLKSGTYE